MRFILPWEIDHQDSGIPHKADIGEHMNHGFWGQMNGKGRGLDDGPIDSMEKLLDGFIWRLGFMELRIGSFADEVLD